MKNASALVIPTVLVIGWIAVMAAVLGSFAGFNQHAQTALSNSAPGSYAYEAGPRPLDQRVAQNHAN